jgi:acetyltransferase-like isoleucine patch superfamily enzyme
MKIKKSIRMSTGTVKAVEKNIDKTVKFGSNVSINCEKVTIGKFATIGNNVKIQCKELEIGDNLFMANGVEIGRGGCTGHNSTVKIGNNVGIFENTIINPSESVEIGDNCGIGADVMIWTHGAWLDITQGFPSDFGPVKIGKNVWLPARSIVLPNVTIGNDVVIGINSIINRSLPDGCFAAGSPCKVIKENVYPKNISDKILKEMALNIITEWSKLISYKGIDDFLIQYKSGKIYLSYNESKIIYYLREKTMEGDTNEVAEDLRDFLRRRGIKIYTNKLFRSIKPTWVK